MKKQLSEIKIFSDAQTLAAAAGDAFLKYAKDVIEENGRFTVALSGGSTPTLLYNYLVEKVKIFEDYQNLLRKIHFFWGDERDVPAENFQSNYGNAYKDFFSRVQIPREHIHRIKPETGGASKAAEDYEQLLKVFFKLDAGKFPRFDLIFLGMGPDGHIASLFPGSGSLGEKKRLVVAPFIKKYGAYRVTLTVPVINNAGRIIFLVAGDNKAEMVQKIFKNEDEPEGYPVQRITPLNGLKFWFIDQAAAGLLTADFNKKRRSHASPQPYRRESQDG